MAQTIDSVPIQFELALSKLARARDVVRADGGETRISLELAAAQMAVSMAASASGQREVMLVEDLIEAHRQEVNPEHTPGDENHFTVEDVLSEVQRAFLPSARVVVGLTYQAARYNTRTLFDGDRR